MPEIFDLLLDCRWQKRCERVGVGCIIFPIEADVRKWAEKGDGIEAFGCSHLPSGAAEGLAGIGGLSAGKTNQAGGEESGAGEEQSSSFHARRNTRADSWWLVSISLKIGRPFAHDVSDRLDHVSLIGEAKLKSQAGTSTGPPH